MNDRELFTTATGHEPYPYQTGLATYEKMPRLLSVPTGVGKTAAAVLSWLYRRRFATENASRAILKRCSADFHDGI